MIQGYRSLLLLALSTVLIGCTESDREEATGKANIRAVNAIVGAPNVNFLIEERQLDNIAFKSSMAAQQYDDLSYDFRFELTLPGASGTMVLAEEFVDVEADRDYVFVLDGTVAAPSIRLWDDAITQWDGSESVFELRFAHLADTVGEVDVYFGEAGTAPVAGNQVATLGNGDRSDPMEFPAGDHQVTLTPAGDPQTILYRSGERTFAGATTDDVVVFDRDPSITGNVNVRHITGAGSSTELPDERFPPQVQFVHAAFNAGNVDIAEDGDFNPPLVADLAFGERTADTDVTAGAVEYTYTAAGNMGATLIEEELTNAVGLYYNRVLIGSPDDLDIINQPSSRRPFTTNPRLAIMHAAANFENLDVYLLPTGESIADNSPSSPDFAFGTASGMTSVATDEYELTLTLPDEETVVAGPVSLDLAAGDVVQALFLDTADPNVAEILVYSPQAQ